jgi:hypothetical protein
MDEASKWHLSANRKPVDVVHSERWEGPALDLESVTSVRSNQRVGRKDRLAIPRRASRFGASSSVMSRRE